jgi:hypothetical protein
VIGHPFLGLAGALASAADELDLPVTDPAIGRLRDANLSRFADLAPIGSLRREADVAAVLVQLSDVPPMILGYNIQSSTREPASP